MTQNHPRECTRLFTAGPPFGLVRIHLHIAAIRRCDTGIESDRNLFRGNELLALARGTNFWSLPANLTRWPGPDVLRFGPRSRAPSRANYLPCGVQSVPPSPVFPMPVMSELRITTGYGERLLRCGLSRRRFLIFRLTSWGECLRIAFTWLPLSS